MLPSVSEGREIGLDSLDSFTTKVVCINRVRKNGRSVVRETRTTRIYREFTPA